MKKTVKVHPFQGGSLENFRQIGRERFAQREYFKRAVFIIEMDSLFLIALEELVKVPLGK